MGREDRCREARRGGEGAGARTGGGEGRAGREGAAAAGALRGGGRRLGRPAAGVRAAAHFMGVPCWAGHPMPTATSSTRPAQHPPSAAQRSPAQPSPNQPDPTPVDTASPPAHLPRRLVAHRNRVEVEHFGLHRRHRLLAHVVAQAHAVPAGGTGRYSRAGQAVQLVTQAVKSS